MEYNLNLEKPSMKLAVPLPLLRAFSQIDHAKRWIRLFELDGDHHVVLVNAIDNSDHALIPTAWSDVFERLF